MTGTRKRSTSEGFTDEERAAMKDRAKEMRRPRVSAADDEAAVVEKIAELTEPDRGLAQRVHAVITTAAPSLSPKLWYGMPAYAKDGKVICFFQPAQRFKARYATLGFNDPAHLDEGAMWPTAFALTRLTAVEEKAIAALVKRAVD